MKVMKRARLRFRKMWEAGRFKRIINRVGKYFPKESLFHELLFIIAERNLCRAMDSTLNELRGATC